ncbi:MAG: hypothetical protein AAGD13_00690 [Pseudomonadota bacterium]
MNSLELARGICRLDAFLSEFGLRAQMECDLTRALVILDQLGVASTDAEGNQVYSTKLLHPERSGLRNGECFFLFLFDGPNVVGKIAARRDCLSNGDNWKTYGSRLLKALYPEDPAPVAADRFPPITEQITGNVTYAGDLYLRKGTYGGAPVRAFVLMLYYLVAAWWSVPDWLVCYVRARQTENRSWMDGPWQFIPEALSFSHPPSATDRSTWMGYLDKPGFTSLLCQIDDVTSWSGRAEGSQIGRAPGPAAA